MKHLFCFLFFFISSHLAVKAQEENPVYGIGFCTSGTYTINLKTSAKHPDINRANVTVPNACNPSMQVHIPLSENEMIYFPDKGTNYPNFKCIQSKISSFSIKEK